MVTLLRKFIGDPGEKAVAKIRQQVVPQINALEPAMQALSFDELKGQTERFCERLASGETLDDLLPEAFATVREMARHVLGQRHYDVQLIGGVALHRGQIAEMKTGEGKTLVATLPVYLNALNKKVATVTEEEGTAESGDGAEAEGVPVSEEEGAAESGDGTEAEGVPVTEGRRVHVVTVNDYLALRDTRWMGPIYHHLGLTVGCLQHDAAYQYYWKQTDDPKGMGSLKKVSRAKAYRCNVLYGTNSEFGFDYLRSNMALEEYERVQGKLNYAIVDEVDNILIDEARTPLIISGPAPRRSEDYRKFARFAKRLVKDIDYTIDERTEAISLTPEGIKKMERRNGVSNLYDPENYHLVHYIDNALAAKEQKLKDQDYVVQDGEVVIVDEFTGRLQFGRRWSDGLHQAVEAKEIEEDVPIRIQEENRTHATITLQNYFRMYDKLAGMTGTAATEADEFYKIYGLEVLPIPTNLPMIREDKPDLVFLADEAKGRAVVEEIVSRYESRQPVLVGTTSVEASLALSERLKERGVLVPHQVLNATEHAKEADIITYAGRLGAVTVATNMAGRGTDIVLGGTFDSIRTEKWKAITEVWKAIYDKGSDLSDLSVGGTLDSISPEEWKSITEVWKAKHDKGIDLSDLLSVLSVESRTAEDWQEEHNQVVDLGGLHILGTEHHEARRIDNQLRGRSGRQGDPGSSQFYVALEDELMQRFGGDRIKSVMNLSGMDADTPIENKLISKSISGAQEKVEGYHFDLRKHLLNFDDVLNRQRETFYSYRDRILLGYNLRDTAVGMLRQTFDSLLEEYLPERDDDDWDTETVTGFVSELAKICPLTPDLADQEQVDLWRREGKIREVLADYAETVYTAKESELGSEAMRQLERRLLLRGAVDYYWREHLTKMEELRTGVGLHAYGQRDPLVVYRAQGYQAFEKLLKDLGENPLVEIRDDLTVPFFHLLFNASDAPPPNGATVARPRVSAATPASPMQSVVGNGRQPQSGRTKIGRNAPCPCGSGRKYKRCCGGNG